MISSNEPSSLFFIILNFIYNFNSECNAPVEKGPCDIHSRRYFYDKDTNSCKIFKNGHCEGNENSFTSIIECESECKVTNEECICNAIYDPVCGTNDIDYENPCEASCAGVDIGCTGRCPCEGAVLLSFKYVCEFNFRQWM